MKLLTREIKDRVPGPGETEGIDLADMTVHAKFFTPGSSWTWYLLEYDPETGNAFGLVDGMAVELGDFRIDDLEALRLPHGLGVERDRYFGTPKVGDLLAAKTGNHVSEAARAWWRTMTDPA